MTVSSRERVRSAIRHQPPDQLPCNDSFWEDTLPAWREQGMPSEVTAEEYFKFDIAAMYLDPSPRFPQHILKEEQGYWTYEDRFGYTVKKRIGHSGTLEFLNHYLHDRSVWEAEKHRYQLVSSSDNTARIDDRSYFAHFEPYPTWEDAQAKYQRIFSSGRYLLFHAYGPVEALWRQRGFTEFLMDTVLEPDWMRDVADTYQNFVIEILHWCLDWGMKPDGYFMVEDLAYNTGMLFSPDTWRSIFRPGVKKLGEFLHSQGIDFWMHSDGDMRVVIDDLIACGVQVLNPLQVTAGLDVVEMYERYRGKLAFYGNIGVSTMLGSQCDLEGELRRKIPLAREGGYIFHSDHSVPPQVSFERYQWMLDFARTCFDRST